MKRPHQTLTKSLAHREGDIRRSLSQQQLATIGAVALAYNEVEQTLDELFFTATGLHSELAFEVSNRVQHIDGKIAIIQTGAAILGMDATDLNQLREATGTHFYNLKGLRNGVVHSRVIDAIIGVGVSVEKKNQRKEVLLSEPALNWLFDRLIELKSELSPAHQILAVLTEHNKLAIGDPKRMRSSKTLQSLKAQFRNLQRIRASQPQEPEFPDYH